MIYAVIMSQNQKHLVSAKNMESVHLKYDEAENLYKIKARMRKKQKITLAKYREKENAEFVFKYIFVLWGMDIHEYDHCFESFMADDMLRKLFLAEDIRTRLRMPQEDEVSDYLEYDRQRKIEEKKERAEKFRKEKESLTEHIKMKDPYIDPVAAKRTRKKEFKTEPRDNDFFLFENRLTLEPEYKDDSIIKPE